jgi:hypothetical protein
VPVSFLQDFVRPKPIPALSAVARWMIFAQGLLDAIIYGIIEVNFRSVSETLRFIPDLFFSLSAM